MSEYIQFINASKKHIKHISEWRNLIFASGAFPKVYLNVSLTNPHSFRALIWQNWEYRNKAKKLIANPTNYADYTIRNPIFNAALQYYSSTTSIKYTFLEMIG